MTALERRGKCLFLVIACLIVLDKLYGVGLALTNNDGQVRWATSVLQPIVLALAVAMLWWGDNRLRIVAAGLCVLSGAERIFVSLRILRVLATAGPDGDSSILGLFGIPVGAVAAVGVLYVVAGLLLAFSPSMREFFGINAGSITSELESVKRSLRTS